MLNTRKLMVIFIPALLVAGIGLFVRIIQYEPLFPEIDETAQEPEVVTVPIFPDDPIIGNKKSPITIIAFEDFGCPACRQQTVIFDELINKHPKRVKVVWKGLPVTQFPIPTEASQKYGYCAHRQGKFEPFKIRAFENIGNLTEETLESIANQIGIKQKKFQECLNGGDADQYIERVKQVAQFVNIQAVPTIFVDGTQIEAPHSVAGWEHTLGLASVTE